LKHTSDIAGEKEENVAANERIEKVTSHFLWKIQKPH
jgi:hypothetical protein